MYLGPNPFVDNTVQCISLEPPELKNKQGSCQRAAPLGDMALIGAISFENEGAGRKSIFSLGAAASFPGWNVWRPYKTPPA